MFSKEAEKVLRGLRECRPEGFDEILPEDYVKVSFVLIRVLCSIIEGLAVYFFVTCVSPVILENET